MPESDLRPTVTRNDEENRYEIRLGDDLAGYSTFMRLPDDDLLFPHTWISPQYEGHGLGTTLISEAMADVAQRGEGVIPACPFVAHYLREHEVPGLRVMWPANDES